MYDWELQRRGVWHLHFVLGMETAIERAWAFEYVAALRELGAGCCFGFVDAKPLRSPQPAERASGYLSKYLAKWKADGSMEVTETVLAAGRTLLNYVSRKLTAESGITMRVLRTCGLRGPGGRATSRPRHWTRSTSCMRSAYWNDSTRLRGPREPERPHPGSPRQGAPDGRAGSGHGSRLHRPVHEIGCSCGWDRLRWMADVAGFWSYARADDEADGGRISRLADRVKAEYALITGREIDVFLDRTDLAWGDEWKRRIDEALLGTAFFIPVVTPRYFGRPECRRELLTFAGHAASLGVDELLLPLLYIDVPDMSPESDDEAVALVARMHYADWRELRLEDESASEYRRGVHELAKRLAEIGTRLVSVGASEVAEGPSGGDAEDEAPGWVELLAAMEEAMPQWQATMESMTPVLGEIGNAMERAGAEVQQSDSRGGGFAGRLRVAAALGKALDGPATRFVELATTWASELVTVDAGMLTIIRRAAAGIDDNEERASICELFRAVKQFADLSRQNYESMQGFSGTVAETAAMSREIRPPIRKLQAGLQRMMDGQAVIDEWERQIDASGLECGEGDSATT
jgi:uncharacterized protein YukE